jgi:hypothetical protein
MPSETFQIAAKRAASSYAVDVWLSLGTSERAAAIYRELRNLDAESVSALQPGEKPLSDTG